MTLMQALSLMFSPQRTIRPCIGGAGMTCEIFSEPALQGLDSSVDIVGLIGKVVACFRGPTLQQENAASLSWMYIKTCHARSCFFHPCSKDSCFPALTDLNDSFHKLTVCTLIQYFASTSEYPPPLTPIPKRKSRHPSSSSPSPIAVTQAQETTTSSPVRCDPTVSTGCGANTWSSSCCPKNYADRH